MWLFRYALLHIHMLNNMTVQMSRVYFYFHCSLQAAAKSCQLLLSNMCICAFLHASLWDYAYVRIYTHKYLSEKIICCLVKWYVKFPIYCLSKELTIMSLDRKVHYLCAQFIYWLEYHLHARAVIIESGEEISFLSPLNLFTIEVLGLLLFHMKNSSRGIMLL